MYSLLPFITARLPEMPIEVWCNILRMLDSKSLVSAVRNSSSFSIMARGDPILRQKVRSAIKEEEEEIVARLRRPGITSRVERSSKQAELYSKNSQKKTTIRKEPKMFKVCRVAKKEPSDLKIRSKVCHSYFNNRVVNMYSLLPFITARLPEMPIEVWCNILRMLDSKSLLSAVRSSSSFSYMARGDPILRQKVRSAIEEEKKEIVALLRRPELTSRVERSSKQAELYSKNSQKKTTIRKEPKMFKVCRVATKEPSDLKIRSKVCKSSRFNPYRI
ncbi:unnamed protein product [Ceutorhynchus assimilis]|uniref:F-box domain-containing protein n=1 Tax=Ceutorhynchus assimilis TaxID=467358 RepID=A0A9N9QJB0_9CUCU|nr:unnamed protein product [Ceutorhynchus assimilis]